MVPENESTVRRFFEELWNTGDLDSADEMLAPGHVHHLGDDRLDGPEAVKEAVRRMRTAFPDLHFTLEDVVSDGDRVVVRWTATGTHEATFGGVAGDRAECPLDGHRSRASRGRSDRRAVGLRRLGGAVRAADGLTTPGPSGGTS